LRRILPITGHKPFAAPGRAAGTNRAWTGSAPCIVADMDDGEDQRKSRSIVLDRRLLQSSALAFVDRVSDPGARRIPPHGCVTWCTSNRGKVNAGVLHRIDAHHMLALQVGEHGRVIDRLERLPGAVTALHLRELADTGHELVRAGWGIPCLARLFADEARRFGLSPRYAALRSARGPTLPAQAWLRVGQ